IVDDYIISLFEYIFSFTNLFIQDILKLTNIKCIKASTPQSIAVDWGAFAVDYVVLFFITLF
ncbi:hypothetical protein, partial [Staphylococcus epidermidis]|uniref:hypothetical protein n=1 Tax=Staphylococcus epidermidis TaxID=1282 RepID=UPI001D0D1DA3